MLDSQRKLQLFKELTKIQTKFPPFHEIDPRDLELFRAVARAIEGSATKN